jgi:hypothetical protein
MANKRVRNFVHKKERKMNFNSRMKLISGLLLIVAVALIVGSPARVAAQDVAVGEATATILTALTVTADSAIRFGDVLQGVPVTVSNASNDSSGVFRIVGAPGREVSIYLALPEYLSHTTGGQDRMVISFASTDGAWDDSQGPLPAPEDGTSTAFNPYQSQTLTLDAVGGNMAIFMGGTVHPSVDQTAGSYSGDIVMTVAYNGS